MSNKGVSPDQMGGARIFFQENEPKERTTFVVGANVGPKEGMTFVMGTDVEQGAYASPDKRRERLSRG